jgi:hypothetical protein
LIVTQLAFHIEVCSGIVIILSNDRLRLVGSNIRYEIRDELEEEVIV